MNVVAPPYVTVELTFDTDTEVLKPPTATVLTFKYDPIVAACASYRIWKVSGNRWADLDQMVPLPEDQAMADQVRGYYRAKITWEKLRSTDQRPLSEFRQKLMGMIENTYQITTADLGILHRLPYFYEEDISQDAVFEGYETAELHRNNNHQGTYTFNLDREIFISRKRIESYQFWIKSPEVPVPCLIVVQKENTLLPLMRSVVSRGSVQLTARFFPKWRWSYANEGYYQLGDVKLA